MRESRTPERHALAIARAQLADSGRAIAAAARAGNWAQLQQLDLKMRDLLSTLARQPAVYGECAEQIAALAEQHGLALQHSLQEMLSLSQRVAQALRAREQHAAYRMVDQCL